MSTSSSTVCPTDTDKRHAQCGRAGHPHAGRGVQRRGAGTALPPHCPDPEEHGTFAEDSGCPYYYVRQEDKPEQGGLRDAGGIQRYPPLPDKNPPFGQGGGSGPVWSDDL